MSATDDVARMLTLVPWLLERPGATLDEVADAFGVTEATVRGDLYHLDFCGLPGLGGGDLFEVTIVGDRVTVAMADELRRPLRLTPAEALRLVVTLDAVATVLGDDLPALRSALAKVRAVAGVPERAAVTVGEDDGDRVAPLRAALAAGRQVAIDYRGRADEAPQTRVVDPWALHIADGTWYLQGHDHSAGDHRIFRLDRVAALDVRQQAVEHPAPPGPLPPPRYVPGPEDLEVELDVEAGARWLLDAVDVERRQELSGGRVRVRLRTDAPDWLIRLVLSTGGLAHVAAPPELAARVAEAADRALARYQR